ncbi:MAG TPA: hypothetical protein VI451_19870 [Anaerolineales bacterium]|nr:hypothetical protein [Anaerolineales bacterium]
MKTRFIFILIILTLIIAACQPATPLQGTPSDNQSPENSDGVDSQPVGEVLGEGNQSGQEDSSNTADFPRPEVVWNHDPETLILSGTYCCGFTTPLVPLNYIPDFQIWGDGRYIWVEYSNNDTMRHVLEGKLSEEQLTSLLEKIVNAGFFGWEDRYANQLVSDLADQCMTVHLESTSKTVCEYSEGAPETFHSLYDSLKGGSGVTGTEYTPTSGYLTAFAYPTDAARPTSENDILWPEDSFFPLSDAVDQGVWVEGDAVLLAWQAVNADPWSATVRQGDTFFSVALQVPGLSMNQPPAK